MCMGALVSMHQCPCMHELAGGLIPELRWLRDRRMSYLFCRCTRSIRSFGPQFGFCPIIMHLACLLPQLSSDALTAPSL